MSAFAKSDLAHAKRALASTALRLSHFRADHAKGLVSAELVRQYETLVSYAQRDVELAAIAAAQAAR